VAAGGSSQSDYDIIKSVSSKLNKVDKTKLNSAQNNVLSQVIISVDKYITDTDYDYTNDANNIKSLYNNLSDSEKTGLQNEVIKSGVSVSEALVLQNKFGF
jgi:hypothetical protein